GVWPIDQHCTMSDFGSENSILELIRHPERTSLVFPESIFFATSKREAGHIFEDLSEVPLKVIHPSLNRSWIVSAACDGVNEEAFIEKPTQEEYRLFVWRDVLKIFGVVELFDEWKSRLPHPVCEIPLCRVFRCR